MTPSQLNRPAFLMNVPYSFTTDILHGKWRKVLPESRWRVDREKAMEQFFEVYHFLSARAFVTVLPAPLSANPQDIVFTSNLGFVPEHLAGQSLVILSHFAAAPRQAELAAGKRFFEEMGYEVHCCPHPFEGEADLKFLQGTSYVGCYGQRSSRKAYEWMESEFGLQIVKVEVRDPFRDHFDCPVFPVTGDQALVATFLFSRAELRALEEVAEIIPVNRHFAMMGGCNSVMLQHHWLNGTVIDDLPRSHPYYRPEKEKNWALERIASRTGKVLHLFDLSEFQKAGAFLSCMVLHLNHLGSQMRDFSPAAHPLERQIEPMPAQVA